jgi:very-short-patch-repair endonuclease
VRVVIEGKTVYRDAYYEKYKLATELDGKLAHPDQERWRDNRRDNQAGAHGIGDHSLRLARCLRPPP